ncbi:MAG TPA: DUF3857 domain-containing protein [Bryobacteraceae bacterium]|nr:DUF3857 domain-containing protein [Bryobacteraceae bacterium]
MRALFAPIYLCAVSAAAFAANWPPVTPAELAATAPKVEKDAHAEAILWDIRVADEVTSNYPHSVQIHYLKIKIFDQPGVDMLAKVDISYPKGATVSDIWARTTKRNGETVELGRDAIFDRVLMKGGGVRWNARSFALPGLEPGAVVEYGWKEYHEEAVANYVPIDLQREFPVETINVHLKPLIHPMFPFHMRTMVFQVPQPSFSEERNGFSLASWTNMPAFKEEPDMPAEREVRGWMLVYYEDKADIQPEKYWKDHGRKLFGAYKSETKVDGEVRSIADELTGKPGTDEQKLQRLYEYCRTHVRNINGPHNGLTPEQRTHFKPNSSPHDTLKQEIGNGRDIDLLFTALATAGGFDARMARTGDRGYGIMGWRTPNMYFLPAWSVAVNLNGKWRFFDPGVPTLPFGMLRWQEEGAPALVSDPKDPPMVMTNASLAKDSVKRRTANLKLTDDGTLEGDVRIELTGHLAVGQRVRFEDDNEAQIAEAVKKEIQSQFGEAEISDLKVENLTDTEKPFATSFHLKAAGFAQRTGKRLFFQPAVFQKNEAPRYTSTERKHPVQFEFPWSENDTVTIQLPEGFDLDHADMPPPLDLQTVGHYTARAFWTKGTRTFKYTRDFVFGEQGGVVVSEKNYATLKAIFDSIHEKDTHMITVKQAVTTAAN